MTADKKMVSNRTRLITSVVWCVSFAAIILIEFSWETRSARIYLEYAALIAGLLYLILVPLGDDQMRESFGDGVALTIRGLFFTVLGVLGVVVAVVIIVVLYYLGESVLSTVGSVPAAIIVGACIIGACIIAAAASNR